MGETGTDTPIEAARRMLDIFATVGADRFHVTWTDSAGHPRCPRSLRRNLQSLGGPLPHADNDDWLDAIHIAGIGPTDLGRAIPALLDTANADRLNLTIRPRGTGVRFIQPDDLVEKLPTLTRRHVSHHRNLAGQSSGLAGDARRARPGIRSTSKARR